MPAVLNFKVHRNVAGSHFPFDRLYVFREENLPLVKASCPINISFKIGPKLKKMLKQLQVASYTQNTMGRVKTKSSLPLGWVGKKVCAQAGVMRRIGSQKDSEGLLGELVDYLEGTGSDDWYAMVPILGKSTKNGVAPRYLVNKRWSKLMDPGIHDYQDRYNKIQKQGISEIRTIPDNAVLKVIDEETSPPCLKCERLMAHMAGECQLGGNICLETMSLRDTGYFQEVLADSVKAKGLSLQQVIDMVAKRNSGDPNGIQDNNG